jgi:hypothetical protein
MERVYVADGNPERRVLESMARVGPPFIVGMDRMVKVGDQFRLGNQPFTVIRPSTQEEYQNNMRRSGLSPDMVAGTVCFVEVTTD